MQNYFKLRQQAIQAAQNNDWKLAVKINQEILNEKNNDLEAMNRLGLAFLKLDQIAKAKKMFKAILKIDSSNIIANKHLDKIKNNEKTKDIIFNNNTSFIEEPGKSKIFTLHRLAGKPQLKKLKVGQSCQLQLKNKYISITDEDGKHVGALPDDISFRLSKLIKTGNKYDCIIYKVNEKQCCVQIKEIERSKRNEQIQSFPNKSQGNITYLNEDFVFEENIPVESADMDLGSDPEEGLKMAMEKINKKEV